MNELPSERALDVVHAELTKLQHLVDRARVGGLPGRLIEQMAATLAVYGNEWAAFSGADSAPETLARIASLRARVVQSTEQLAPLVAKAEGDMPWKKLLWIAFAGTLVGGAAYGVWRWSQRDRY